MSVTIAEAKERLDHLIRIARVDLYKPIQIAEVLYRSRTVGDLDILTLSTYQNPSLRWRNNVTRRLSGKISTSSARYQHDVWSATAISPNIILSLDTENKITGGLVERYIYLRYMERQGTVAKMMALLESASPENFQVEALLGEFTRQAGIRRSIDKAYEIVTYSLLETIVVALDTTVRVKVPLGNKGLFREFQALASILLGLEEDQLEREQPAHIYRVGVTNAADRGLDMWANFGPAIQVKHLVLDAALANTIVDQVESDHVIIVCRDADANVIQTIMRQIGWGRRIRGIIRESDLVAWYEKCLRGTYASQVAKPLLNILVSGFHAEFPQVSIIHDFIAERGYLDLATTPLWDV